MRTPFNIYAQRFALLSVVIISVLCGLVAETQMMKIGVSTIGGITIGILEFFCFKNNSQKSPNARAELDRNIVEAQRILSQYSRSRWYGLQSAQNMSTFTASDFKLEEILCNPMVIALNFCIAFILWFDPIFYEATFAFSVSSLLSKSTGSHLLALLFVSSGVFGIGAKLFRIDKK